MARNSVWTSGPLKCRKLKSGGFQVLEDWACQTEILGCAAQVPLFVALANDGKLTVRKGYWWDGPSTPLPRWLAVRRSNLRASLAHDALYQLMRGGRLVQYARQKADDLYRDLIETDGGWRWLAGLDYLGLRVFGRFAAKVQPEVESERLCYP